MVPTQPSARGPFPKSNEILHKTRLLQIVTVAGEAEARRRARSKLCWIRDHVAKALVNRSKIRLHTSLPFVPSMMRGNATLKIFFAEAAVLKRDDARRKRIRTKGVRVIAHHQPQITQQIWCKNVLVRQNPHRFQVGAILSLPRCLLQLFVWHFKFRESMPHNQPQTVALAEIALITQREIAGCCVIGIVLRHRWIQEPVRSRAVYRETHCVLAPRILPQQIGVARSETPSGQYRLPMKAEPRILRRHHLDYSAQLSAVFRGYVRRVDAQRLHIVRLDFLSEAR